MDDILAFVVLYHGVGDAPQLAPVPCRPASRPGSRWPDADQRGRLELLVRHALRRSREASW